METNGRTPTRIFTGAIDGGRFRIEHGGRKRGNDEPRVERREHKIPDDRPRVEQGGRKIANREPHLEHGKREYQNTVLKPAGRTARTQARATVKASPTPARRQKTSPSPTQRQKTGRKATINSSPNAARIASPHRQDTVVFPHKPRRRGRAKFMALAIIFAVLSLFFLPSAVRFATSMLPGQVNTADLSRQEESARSTPKTEWKRGAIPHLYQIDPQWADEPYAGGTIRENGCGPTCLSMVYAALTGHTDRDPAAMARFSEENGFVTEGLTAWALMTDGAAMLGLRGEELAADASAVSNALDGGSPVICSVRPGDFTTTGHFIVLAGINEEGKVIVHDPNSAARSGVAWDLQQVLDQCANLWAFSAA